MEKRIQVDHPSIRLVHKVILWLKVNSLWSVRKFELGYRNFVILAEWKITDFPYVLFSVFAVTFCSVSFTYLRLSTVSCLNKIPTCLCFHHQGWDKLHGNPEKENYIIWRSLIQLEACTWSSFRLQTKFKNICNFTETKGMPLSIFFENRAYNLVFLFEPNVYNESSFSENTGNSEYQHDPFHITPEWKQRNLKHQNFI